MATSETTNLQLVKYGAGTDNFIRTDYNGNLDKIDTFAGTTNQAITKLQTGTVLDNQSSLSGLQSALSTIAASMVQGESRLIRFYAAASFDSFSNANSYIGYLLVNRNNGTRIDFVIQFEGPDGDVIIISRNNGTWHTKDITKLHIAGSSSNATQTFDISNKGFSNPIFILTVGYSTKGMSAIIYMNAIGESDIAFEKISGIGDINISSISYNGNGTITVTFSSNPYRTAYLTALSI